VSIHALTVTPDGAFVDFVRQERAFASELWRVPFLGGAPRKLADNAWSAPGWSPDGKRMAYMVELYGVAVADADGSHATVIAPRKGRPDRYLSLSYVLPQDFRPVWLPDGQSLAVIGNNDARGYTALQLVTVNIATGAERVLQLQESHDLRVGMGMALGPDGHSLILSHVLDGGPPQVVRLDPSSGEIARITNDVNEYAGISAAGDAVASAQRAIQSSLWMADAVGNNARQLDRDVPAELAARGTLQWAGPARLIYYAVLAGGTGLWSLDLATNASQLIVPEGKTPSVSADGRTLVFMRGSGTVRLWRADADGRNAAEVPGALGFTPSVTPDGSAVFYVSIESGHQRAWKVDLGAGGAHEFAPIYVAPYGVAVSPDGRQVALLSFADQHPVILTMPANGGNAVRRLTMNRVQQIRWTPDGRALAYVNPESPSNIWIQSIDGGPARQLTSFTDRRIVAYAWSPDGRQLVISRAIDTSDIVLLRGVH
jgi:Tol biopolymer transport system component